MTRTYAAARLVEPQHGSGAPERDHPDRRAAHWLVRPLLYCRRHRAVTLGLGVLVEASLMALISPAVLGSTKEMPGAVGVAVAVFVAIAAGPAAGATVAVAGGLFLYLVDSSEIVLLTLPFWAVTVYVVGLLGDALLESEHELAQKEMDWMASHEVRTPLAAIAGLSRVLRTQELTEAEERLAEAIENEATGLLDTFDRWKTGDRRP